MNDIELQLKDLYYNQKYSWKTIKEILKISSRTLRKYKQQFQLSSRTIEQQIEAAKETNLKRYGCENPMQNKTIQDKAKETNLKRYGCENPMQNKTIQNKAKETIRIEGVVEKRKQTCLKKYGVEIVSQNLQVLEKMYRTNEIRYGNYCPCNSKEVKQKISRKVKAAFATGKPKLKEYETRKKNNSFNLSREENEVYKLLQQQFPMIEREYTSPLYPFKCDFYIKSLDLYIEYQGTWCHGGEPYDTEKQAHKDLIQKWQSKRTEYFDYAIKVFTYYDPLKRSIAKKHNLNWKEFFSIDEVKEWLKNYAN